MQPSHEQDQTEVRPGLGIVAENTDLRESLSATAACGTVASFRMDLTLESTPGCTLLM